MIRRAFTVEPLPSGRFSVRLRYPDGERERLDSYATREDAERVGAAAVRELGLDGGGGVSLSTYGPKWLDRRELAGHRAIGADRSRWRTWIATAPFYTRPLRSVRRADVLELVRAVPDGSARHVRNLLCRCLGDAVDDGHVRDNVAARIRLPRSARVDEPWTFLEPSEIGPLAAVCTDEEWDVIECARWWGLRDGEQRALRLCDVNVSDDDPHIIVRFGDVGQPTKTGKTRRVPLFGGGLSAARRWLERLLSFRSPSKNERGLMFPTSAGNPRPASRMLGRVYAGVDAETGSEVYVNRFSIITSHAGLFDANPARPLVWHSLRHTCASWLVSGFWGRRWSLEEVKEMLGHTTIQTTQRYAHLGVTALKAAAHEMPTVRGNQFGSRDSNPDSWLQRPDDLRGIESTSEAEWGAVGRLREFVVARDEEGAVAAARTLARLVAARRVTRLAAEVLGEGPLMITRALELADVVEGEIAQAERKAGGT